MIRQRLRAPQHDREVLAEPALAEVGRLLEENRRRLTLSHPIMGRELTALRQQARREMIERSADYLRRAGEPIPSVNGEALLVAGHQPELCHPGVWVKNFALAGLARKHGATPLHLIIDNDTVKSTALRLPACKPKAALVTVPFDAWNGEVPYEERHVQDDQLFDRFPDRAAEALASCNLDGMLQEFWQEVRRQGQRTPLLGERFAAARRALERRWGCCNFELPVSLMCGTPSFAWFVGHLLSHLPRFHAIHNGALVKYRAQHGIRSKSHPVPELVREDDWYEVPLWGWRSGSHRRGRLMARLLDREVQLRIQKETWPGLPSPSDPQRFVDSYSQLEAQGYKVRCRALTNTLFARVFLGDLFVHGIGGGKYDELTDEIIGQFYEIEPPHFMVLSATLRLPLPAHPVQPGDQARRQREYRDLIYNPQRHLNGATNAQALTLAEEKQEWIARHPQTRPERQERFRHIKYLNEQLRLHVSEQVETARHHMRETEEQLHDNAVFQRRDYAFCLYPEDKLKAFYQQFI